MAKAKTPNVEERLKRELEHLAPLLDISPSATVVTDLEANVVAWNPAAQRLFGYSADDAIGRNLDDLVAKTEEIHAEAVGFSRRASTKDQVHTMARRTRKDGSLVDVELLASPLVVDGEAVGTLGIYHDITELQWQKRFFESLLDVSPEAIVTTTMDDIVTSWNPAAEKLFGYTAHEAIGKDLDDLVARREDMYAEAKELDRRGSEGRTMRVVTQRTRKDGSLVDVGIVAGAVPIGDELVAKHVIYHDIGELQRQRRYYEALVQSSPVAIALLDPQGTVHSWNPAAERLFGYTAEEAVDRHIDDLVAARDEIRAEAEMLTRHGLGGHLAHSITRRTRKDGSLVDVEMFGAPVIVAGEPAGFYAMYHDISEIQRQKQYYQSLVESSPVAIVLQDRDATVTSWNPAAERLFGYTAGEAIGRNLDQLVASHPDVLAEAARYTEREAAGELVHAITRRTAKDGSLVDVELLAVPVTVGEEQLGTYNIYHDISEIQRQKRYFQSLLELSPTAIVVTDLESKIVSWNPAAEQLFGYPAEEALGRHLDDLVANRAELRDEAMGFSDAAARGERVDVVRRRTRKDGSLVDVHIISASVVIGEERLGFLVIYHDISEIQRQRRYYEALVESSPVAIALQDRNGTVTSWNPAAEKLFGYTADEAVGRHVDDLVAATPEIRAEADALQRRGMAGELVHAISRRTRKDESLIDVEMFGAPVMVAGEPVGLYAMYHDIGELQRARQEAEAATEAKSAFLATMSHEIRTPLNAVIGMTGLLMDTELSPEQRNYAEVIRGSGDALLAVINEILDFSKIEAGRLELERQPFDLRQCVESALELVARPASAKGLDLAYVVEPEVPAAIVGDVTRLRQVLLNLLNNAVKFTERGEVVLTVEAEPVPGDGGAAGLGMHFAVRDTGIGIPEARMHELFESFSQVDASTTRRYGGTGLGLAISRRLVELMAGRMWAESLEGDGSTFHFTITAQAAPAPAPADRRGLTPQLEGRRVLIVDDNATNRHILRRQTESWGMIARDTESPEEALEWVARGDPFDIAILDMQMPVMDGIALAAEIRQHRPPEALPLALLSSLGSPVGSDADPGFVASLTKPVRPSELFDALITTFGGGGTVDVPEEAPPTTAEPAGGSPLRILVAEDNAVNQRVALLLLEKLGYRADVAADGREALDALDRQSYDVVLMDVQMPEMDGLEATREIHRRWPPEERPRIIAVTANATREDREACLAAGMDDYISKPIHREDLAAALTRSRPLRANTGLDEAGLERLRRTAGDDETLAELVQVFLTDTDRLLSDLRARAKDGAAEQVRRGAHTLKSTAASFGASHLSELSRRLEDMGARGRIEEAPALLGQIETEYHSVRGALLRLTPEGGR